MYASSGVKSAYCASMPHQQIYRGIRIIRSCRSKKYPLKMPELFEMSCHFFSTASRAKAIERYSQASWPVTTTRLPDYRAKRGAIPCPIRNKATNLFRSKRMHTMNIFQIYFGNIFVTFRKEQPEQKIVFFTRSDEETYLGFLMIFMLLPVFFDGLKQ
jgi:hypothetical protein